MRGGAMDRPACVMAEIRAETQRSIKASTCMPDIYDADR
jgi:hypothetical protein